MKYTKKQPKNLDRIYRIYMMGIGMENKKGFRDA